ncbi:MAG: citrate transporter [Clostridia bacterium]|nr:citrate transporter [Clostridia bacterium]
MLVAAFAAVATSIIVPPDSEYLGYFDFKTLSCLYCVLAVVCALRNIKFFYTMAQKIVELFKNIRLCVLALVYITFIGSMLIANDMALLTFLPLGYFVLSSTNKQKYMAFTFIMQNIAANLGGMLTPFGNPQNLYLYSKFNIPNLEFMGIMAPPFIVAIILITLCCIAFVRPEPLEIKGEKVKLPLGKTMLYLCLFALSIAIVFRGIPYWIGLVVITVALLFADRSALKKVDYPLLLTSVFFFIFAGNMARIDAVINIFSFLLEKSTLLFSVASCQVISNVPSAILLSQFTDNYADLLVGVNIGGAGTLIASLASLITYREYTKHNPGGTISYIKKFTAFNFAILFILVIFMLFLR